MAMGRLDRPDNVRRNIHPHIPPPRNVRPNPPPMESFRKATGSDRYIAEIECQREFSKRLGSNFKLALIMTTREYIVILLGLWLVMVYLVVLGSCRDLTMSSKTPTISLAVWSG